MKLQLLGLLLVATSIGAAGCSTSTGVASVVELAAESGVIRIGVRNDNPPMSFIDGQGAWVGFDIDLATALADELALRPELVVVDGTTRISFLQDGSVDLSIASMNHTRARDEAIDFSITYFWDNQSFLVRTGTYEDMDDLIERRVAANGGSSVIRSWREYVAERGAAIPEIVEFDDKLAAMQALRDGAVEGLFRGHHHLVVSCRGRPPADPCCPVVTTRFNSASVSLSTTRHGGIGSISLYRRCGSMAGTSRYMSAGL